MLIASLKPGHDGSLAAVADGRLLFCYEAEKDSHPRYDQLNVDTWMAMFRKLDRLPDVVCHSGWMKGFHSDDISQGAGYFGTRADSIQVSRGDFLGTGATYFSSSHERSHIWCAYGMSPFPQGQPVHCLVYEGTIGRFYSIDERLNITEHPIVLSEPGARYSFLFSVADPSQPARGGRFRLDTAGKLMALTAYGAPGPPDPQEQDVIDWLLGVENLSTAHDKSELSDTPYFNAGVESQLFKNLARKASDAIIGRYINYAERFRTDQRPLIISGGCGLNCDWNRLWAETGYFESVFVPPVANDTGSAIGTAVDAQRELTGSAKITWDVYSGLEPRSHGDNRLNWVPADVHAIAKDIHQGKIVAVMRGACEIGPRALGGRSLLAAPFDPAMTRRLNAIKNREDYRPIAPVVLEHRAAEFFDLSEPSPYMLFFARVLDERLRAVTHVDGSARPQTVNRAQNAFLSDLLEAFDCLTGVPVLCNTSLNYRNRGFLNSEVDLIDYCLASGVDGIIYENRYASLR
ncbi:MAG: carbamoyltransferase C-terminal domain-containing protein [Pseudomonadota bacterium]